jgi:hypothetical protein
MVCMGLFGRMLAWGRRHFSTSKPTGVVQIAEDLWVFPCGAYIESKRKPKVCPLCAKGDTGHYNALIPDLD